MRNSRASTAGLILVILAGLAAFMFLKPDGVDEPATAFAPQSRTAPTPATSETAAEPMSLGPSNSVKANTSATANSQDAAVAAQLDMRSITACHDALLNKKALEYQVNCDNIPAEQTSNLSLCRSQQARAAQQVNEAAAAAASCPQDLLTASSYYEATKKLAVSGDIPAQRCFIQGYFASAAQEGEESRMRKDQVDEYLGLAKKFIDEAFERGDWSVVRWLARSRIGLQDFMLRTAYPFGSDHPDTAYRMNYLLMLGKQQNYEKSVIAHQFVADSKKNKALTSEKFQEAEDWARNMFDQHFNGSQEGASIPQFCERS